MSTEPRPDIDGYADHRAAVPDEHRALRLLRRMAKFATIGHPLADGGRDMVASTHLSPDEADLIRRLKENP